MLRFFFGTIESSMEKVKGMNATLTFDPEGHLQGHTVNKVPKIIPFLVGSLYFPIRIDRNGAKTTLLF